MAGHSSTISNLSLIPRIKISSWAVYLISVHSSSIMEKYLKTFTAFFEFSRQFLIKYFHTQSDCATIWTHVFKLTFVFYAQHASCLNHAVFKKCIFRCSVLVTNTVFSRVNLSFLKKKNCLINLHVSILTTAIVTWHLT